MRSIYKYNILDGQDGVITGPITKIINAAEQHGNIVVWAEVDTDAPARKFQVIPIGTGWNLDPPSNKECVLDTHTFLNTIQLMDGHLVFHVYYKELTPVIVKKPEPSKEKVAVNAKEATFSGTIAMINPDILRKFVH